jgi:hypothetical protein
MQWALEEMRHLLQLNVPRVAAAAGLRTEMFR